MVVQSESIHYSAKLPNLPWIQYIKLSKKTLQLGSTYYYHLPWMIQYSHGQNTMIQYNILKMVFSSHQYQHNHKLAGLGSGGQLIAPRWLHILQHCCTSTLIRHYHLCILGPHHIPTAMECIVMCYHGM